jgi:hypothetical protein
MVRPLQLRFRHLSRIDPRPYKYEILRFLGKARPTKWTGVSISIETPVGSPRFYNFSPWEPGLNIEDIAARIAESIMQESNDMAVAGITIQFLG